MVYAITMKTLTNNEAIERCKNKFPNAPYDYSQLKYVNSKTPIKIICTKHECCMVVYLETFLRTKGCEECSGLKRYDTDTWIDSAKKVHGNKYDYSCTKYINSVTKITIKCRIHGKFKIRPRSHLSGSNCRKCAGNHKYTTKEWIIEAQKIHENKYTYDKTTYKNNNSKVIITCSIHGDFKQLPRQHLYSNGCSQCNDTLNNKNTKNKKTKTKWNTTSIVEACKLVHDDIDYSKSEYINKRTTMVVTCKYHGDFNVLPLQHLAGSRCSACINNRKYTQDQFVAICSKLHNNMYSYANTVYLSMHDDIDLECTQHGKFNMKASNHFRGAGCSKCNGNYHYTHKEFVIKANTIFDNKYKYITKYTHSQVHITVNCPEHGDFVILPSLHLIGRGCPDCTIKQYSRAAIDWLKEIMKRNKIDIIHAENEGEYTIPDTKLRADGFDINTYTVYEFYGDYYHGNPKIYDSSDMNIKCGKTYGELYQDTKRREKIILSKGYNIAYIWESNWKKILNGTRDKLYTLIKCNITDDDSD